MLLLALLTVQMFPRWIWAVPLEPVSKPDLAGFSKREIVGMGRAKWAQVAYKHYLAGADHDTLIFARCAYDLNRALLARPGTANRHAIEETRAALWLMANASIALYWYRDGMGTSSVHLPRDARAEVEELTFHLLTRVAKVHLRRPFAKLRAGDRHELASWLHSKEPPPYHAGSIRQVHLYAKRALRYFDKALAACHRLGRAREEAVMRFLDRWTVSGIDREGRAN